MANEVTKTEGQKFREQFTAMEGEFQAGLPPHMPKERFMRVVLTAVNGNPDLLDADRRSLFEAAMKAAQDGLLPDGREGALVIYNTKISKQNEKPEKWIKKVQWMPMVQGILKKVRNSGELKSISAHVVYEKDKFTYKLGDVEIIEHEPFLDGDAGKPLMAYAIAWTKDGGIYREVMTIKQVEQVRSVSKAKDGPAWKNWWDEMAKKVTLRRLSKRLPQSTDLDDLLRRDDDLYDFSGKREDGPGFTKVESPLRDTLPPTDAGGTIIEHDEQTGETTSDDEIADDNPRDDLRTQTNADPQGKRDNITTGPQASQATDSHSKPATAQAEGPKIAQLADGEPAAYGDEDQYLIWMRWHIANQKTMTALKEKFGSTRADRRELLSVEALATITNEYNAKIAEFVGAE